MAVIITKNVLRQYQSKSATREVLGCLVNNPSLLLTHKITADDFVESFYKIIFGAIKNCYANKATKLDAYVIEEYLKEAVSDLQSENIKVKFLGEINRFSEKIRDLALKVENSSKNNDGMALNIAINYGGRKEIVNATKMIAKNILEKKIQISEIDESLFSNFLYTSGQPDVDLIIRTGGEFRISNFLIWQSAYAEYISTDILWPDFKTNNLDDALNIYAKRNRRFGGV